MRSAGARLARAATSKSIAAIAANVVGSVALVSTDELVPVNVLAQLRENSAVKFARSVEFHGC
ncbi:MAG: hypothetical protein JWP63_2591 [Candidatus Solibacter sp.]|jgi:hypothetical protein|nr:hypothetical protein [Candidatus Solibacter sp.]